LASSADYDTPKPGTSSTSPPSSPPPPESPTETTSSGPSTETAPSAQNLSTHPPGPPASIQIPVHLIDARDDRNVRRQPDPTALRALADSIDRLGLRHPITVRKLNDRYELIAGHRRTAACILLGWTHVPACVTEDDERTATAWHVAENADFDPLSPVEQADNLSRLQEMHQCTAEELAAMIGRSAAWVYDRLAILRLPRELQDAVHARQISLAAARPLATVENPEHRAWLLSHAVHSGATARTTTAWARDYALTGTQRTETGQPAPPTPGTAALPLPTLRCLACGTETSVVNIQRPAICPDCFQLLTAPPGPAPPHTDTVAASTAPRNSSPPTEV
jgi:ParB/RepB/Spo0J family partition protein